MALCLDMYTYFFLDFLHSVSMSQQIVKIGSAVRPFERFRHLHTGNIRLMAIGIIPGNYEKYVQAKFAGYRVRPDREFFYFGREIQLYVLANSSLPKKRARRGIEEMLWGRRLEDGDWNRRDLRKDPHLSEPNIESEKPFVPRRGYVSIDDAAAFVSVSANQIYKWSNELPGFPVIVKGRQIRLSDLKRYLGGLYND